MTGFLKKMLVLMLLLAAPAAFAQVSNPGSTQGNPGNLAAANLTAQAANIAATTIYTVPAGAGGTYRLSCYVVLTQAATTSSTLPSCNIIFTDADTSTVETMGLTGTSAANTIGTVGLVSVGNLLNTGTFQAKASTNIQYSTTAYASTGATVMQYAIHVKLEFLGP